MSVATPVEDKVEVAQTDAQIKRVQFEEFVVAKLTNMNVRLKQLIKTSNFDDAMKTRFELMVEEGVQLLCQRSPMGELNVLLLTIAVLMPYYNVDDDTFDIIAFVEKNISDTKVLLDMIIENNEDAMEKPAVQQMAENIECFDKIVDTPFFGEALAITTPYLKMFCELSVSK